LCWADLAIFVGGFAYAVWLKRNDRAKYETVGRMINTGLDAEEPAAAPAAVHA
jgi:hypothetical protein